MDAKPSVPPEAPPTMAPNAAPGAQPTGIVTIQPIAAPAAAPLAPPDTVLYAGSGVAAHEVSASSAVAGNIALLISRCFPDVKDPGDEVQSSRTASVYNLQADRVPQERTFCV